MQQMLPVVGASAVPKIKKIDKIKAFLLPQLVCYKFKLILKKNISL